MISERQIYIAAELYKIRSAAKNLLGDTYKTRMAELGGIIRMTADRDSKSAITVAAEVCKKNDLSGMDMLLIMSAAVELIEPSV